MKINVRTESTQFQKKSILPLRRQFRMLSAALLMLVLTASILPVGAMPAGKNALQTFTLTFTAEADSRVQQDYPNTNYGTNKVLLVNGANNVNVESFIRFTVSGGQGSIQSARLRVYVTTNSSTNSPAVYGADNNWTETGITWNNRPARIGNVLDNKGATSTNTWVEYDVTAFVTGNQTYTFALVPDSGDGISLSSREDIQPPSLVVTFNAALNTPTASQTATGTALPASATNTPIVTQSITSTALPVSTLTFPPTADARVYELYPATNYGASTTLTANGIAGERQASYLRFTTTGISGSVQRATLRVFCTTNGTTNGPALYLANSDWTESGTGGITWNNRPSLLSSVVDNKTSIGTNVWVEYDVTSLVTGNGTYTFALVADSTDGITLSSREGAAPPQLVVTLGAGTPPATATLTATITPGSSGSAVLVGAGDIASCNRVWDEQTAQLLDTIPGTVFTTGDNVYPSGTYTEYVNCYEPTWGRHKSRTMPSPGNHDYLTSGAAGYFQYFNTIPAYYAYDLGSWRIYSLNSETSVSATSAQITWLQNDLAANPRQCVLAYWHKPRWSSGSTHGSNTAMQTIWQIFYNAGAELVINGHEHQYERFAQMDASGTAVTQGLREIVVGTGGGESLYPFGTPLAASQIRNNTAYGVVKLTLHETSYDWEFVPVVGSTFTDSGSTACH